MHGPEDIETAFREATGVALRSARVKQRQLNFPANTIVSLATRNRLPAIYAVPEYVEDGGLMSYTVIDTDLYRRAAVYVDKILKGAKPADLPVEQPKKFEFIINLKAAKQIGLTIPPNVLARATKANQVIL